MSRDLTTVPAEILDCVDNFFATPLKRDRNGELHDIRRSSLRRNEALALALLVCEVKPEQCLEIGLAEAGSCVVISASRRYCGLATPHIVLDPFQQTLTASAGLLELERLGLAQSISWLPERSESFLHNHWKRGQANFDFAFVDGGHDLGQKVTDAFFLNKVIRPGGVVAFHDALLGSTASAVHYLVRECGYSIIRLPADDRLSQALRRIRYLFQLGHWYALNIIPALCRSLVALRKPVGVSQP
jgi:predicted O-methyltransferase YrrM